MSSSSQNKPQSSGNELDQFNDMSANAISNFLVSPIQSTTAIFAFLGGLVYGFFRTSAVPAELLFKYNHGSRYFNLYLYIAGAFWFWLYASGIINFPRWMGINPEPLISSVILFTVFGFTYFGFMFYHLVISKFRELDLSRYSPYDGDVFPFLYKLPFALDSNGNPKEYFVRQVYLPLFIAGLGVAFILVINAQFGSFLLLSSVGFAITEMMRQQKVRNMVLDQIDADIIARNMKAALKGESPKSTQGVYIAGLPNEGKLKDRFIDSIKNKDEVFTAQ